MATIVDLIGDARCDTDAQCRTIAVGANACGGPEAYLPWSTQRTDAHALQAAVERHAVSQRKEIERSGAASTCQMVLDPGAYCAAVGSATSVAAPDRARACRLRAARPTGAGAIR